MAYAVAPRIGRHWRRIAAPVNGATDDLREPDPGGAGARGVATPGTGVEALFFLEGE